MDNHKLGAMETRFAHLIWEHAPIPSGELVRLCQKELNWKKSTTYTMLRRLCQRGLFENTDGCVRTLISRDAFYAMQSEQFVRETFHGSLPMFLSAFSSAKKLSEEEIATLEALIADARRGS